MPLDFSFKEAKRHSVGAEGGYSTDLGARAGGSWTHYNLLGNAERLRLTALITGLGGSAQQGLGYDVYADFFKPDFLQRNQNLSARIEGLRQLFWSYRQTAFLIRGGITRPLAKNWNGSFGLMAEQEKIEQFDVTRDYTIISAPLSVMFDNTGVGNPIEPATHGVRASMSITPSVSLGNKGSGTSFFAILNGTASTYFDLHHLASASRATVFWLSAAWLAVFRAPARGIFRQISACMRGGAPRCEASAGKAWGHSIKIRAMPLAELLWMQGAPNSAKELSVMWVWPGL